MESNNKASNAKNKIRNDKFGIDTKQAITVTVEPIHYEQGRHARVAFYGEILHY